MSAFQHETLLALPSSTGLPQLASTAINLMPFHLDYTGPAEISTYFQPRTVPDPSNSVNGPDGTSDKTITIAAFRGRRVQAHTLDLPEGYTGLVLTAPPVPPQSNPTHLQPSSVTQLSGPVKSLKREESPLPNSSAPGLRRSPRKRNAVDVLEPPVTRRVKPKRVMQKFSMDSDSEDGDEDDVKQKEDEDEGVVIQETSEVKAETVVMEKATVVLESSTTTTTTTTTTAPFGGRSPQTLPEDLSTSILPPGADLVLDLDLDLLQPAPLLFSRTLHPQATFSSLTIWNPDGPLDEGKDEYCRALGEWMRLNDVLHRD